MIIVGATWDIYSNNAVDQRLLPIEDIVNRYVNIYEMYTVNIVHDDRGNLISFPSIDSKNEIYWKIFICIYHYYYYY